jgi:hypothetical protein
MLWLLAACTRLETPPLPSTGLSLPPVEAREWVDIWAHPCALDSEGIATCWVSPTWREPPAINSSLFRHDALPVAGERMFGEPGPTIMSHSPGGPIHVDFCGNPGAPGCIPPEESFLEASHNGGINLQGALWDRGSNPEPLVTEPGRVFRALAKNSRPSAVDQDNQLVVSTAAGFQAHPLGHDRIPTHTVGSRSLVSGSTYESGGCVLDVSGEVTCVGDVEMSDAVFPNGPYRFIDGALNVVCAVREVDDLVECNDGETYDLGSIRKLAVYPYQVPGEGVAPVDGVVAMCAITMDNAIRCAGPHYPPDLLAELEALPR